MLDYLLIDPEEQDRLGIPLPLKVYILLIYVSTLHSVIDFNTIFSTLGNVRT